MPSSSVGTAAAGAARSLRVLVVGRGVVPIKVGCGGAELAMYQLSKTLALAGHQVTVISDVVESDFPGTPGLRFVPPKGRLYRLAARLPAGFAGWVVRHLLGNLAGVARARELLRTETYDIVHAHANLAAYLLARAVDVPVVYTEQDSTPWSCRYRRLHERLIRRAIYRLVNVPAFRRVACTATVCESLRLELLERWGIESVHVTAIPNGADFDVFNPHARDVASPSPFDRYCLFVGSLTPRKAPDILIRALVEAPTTNCVFAGAGPMREELELLAVRLGVAERVAFLGSLGPGELAPLYCNADLLVIPSVSEAAPLVAVEAMACGTPVLSSRIAGLPELVHDWGTGFLVKPEDVGQLAIAIRFLTMDREELQRMGARARRSVRKRFLWPSVAREYLTLYHALLPQPKEPAPEPDRAPAGNRIPEAAAA
jgi:glycosyltransferase involved in cell wall biosynthesis